MPEITTLLLVLVWGVVVVVHTWRQQRRAHIVTFLVTEDPMGDLNLDQKKTFHVAGLTAKGKSVPLTAADVSWSASGGDMEPTQPDGSAVFDPTALGAAVVTVSPGASPVTPGVASCAPVASALTVDPAPVTAFAVTADAAV